MEMEIEDRVRLILTAPGSVSQVQLSKQTGLSRSSVQSVLAGRLYRHVLPELPRQKEPIRVRRCWDCSLAQREYKTGWFRSREPGLWCSLGYPESSDPGYAKECPAFIAKQPDSRSSTAPVDCSGAAQAAAHGPTGDRRSGDVAGGTVSQYAAAGSPRAASRPAHR